MEPLSPRPPAASPRLPAAARANATCCGRRPRPRLAARAVPRRSEGLGQAVLKEPLPLAVAQTVPARLLAAASAARQDEEAGGWQFPGAPPKCAGWGGWARAGVGVERSGFGASASGLRAPPASAGGWGKARDPR